MSYRGNYGPGVDNSVKYFNEGNSKLTIAASQDKAGQYDMAKQLYAQAKAKYNLALQQPEISAQIKQASEIRKFLKLIQMALKIDQGQPKSQVVAVAAETVEKEILAAVAAAAATKPTKKQTSLRIEFLQQFLLKNPILNGLMLLVLLKQRETLFKLLLCL